MMIISAKYLVTYSYKSGIASADFFTLEEALSFARLKSGSRVYVRNAYGEWVVYSEKEKV